MIQKTSGKQTITQIMSTLCKLATQHVRLLLEHGWRWRVADPVKVVAVAEVLQLDPTLAADGPAA